MDVPPAMLTDQLEFKLTKGSLETATQNNCYEPSRGLRLLVFFPTEEIILSSSISHCEQAIIDDA